MTTNATVRPAVYIAGIVLTVGAMLFSIGGWVRAQDKRDDDQGRAIEALRAEKVDTARFHALEIKADTAAAREHRHFCFLARNRSSECP